MRDISERLARLSPAQRRLLEERLARTAETTEPIAIVGMACRFPGAKNLDAYWHLIADGVDATSEVPADRWDVDAFFDPDPDAPGKMYTRWGGFIDDVDKFDPLFFGIAPREASRMDPQQRVLLEVAWEALEHAGIAPERLAGSATGVFIGIGGTDYSKIPTHFENHFEYIDAHVGTGNALSIAANRISYVLDLRGPSFIVDTACSSALLAVHLAIQSLRSRECHLALAGGVNLILSPEVMIAFSKARMLSPTGKCRPFDAAADGYVRGEGCGIIVLKRLGDALRDGDNIWAILRGSATNQDGRTSGITAPNARSQQEVIRSALANARVQPREVTYIEAHGTGTPLGDPIEIQGLQPIFRRASNSDPPCYLTSVKANIGHTETASGIAGIIKVALMMRHGLIPGQLHLRELNPNIRLDGTRLVIPKDPLPWEVPPGQRIAGVSSYGFGGTNVHVVMQDYVMPVRQGVTHDRPLHVFTLSAKSSSSLNKLAAQFRDFLANRDDLSVADLCHTVTAGRSHFNHRLAITAGSVDQLRKRLDDFLAGKRNPKIKAAQVRLLGRPKIVFLFTGQGSQYTGMGWGLYESCPVFREAIERCDSILRQYLPQPLLSVLYPEKFGNPAVDSSELIDETLYTQPALFAIEYALACLWQSWGVEPDYVLGHSVGEYVAACVAGVFSLEDGLKLIAHRARLMSELPRDGMMAVLFTSEEPVRRAIAGYEDQVAIAAVNGPENTVLSGRAEIVQKIIGEFQARGIGVHPLTVSHAFHSPLMEPILDRFEALAAEVHYCAPAVPLISNLTGEILETIPDARYWRNHIRAPVLFAQQIARLAEEKPDIWLEVGPAPVLLGMARRCVSPWRGVAGASLRKGHDDWEVLLETVSELYIAGAHIDWQAFDRSWPRKRLELPSYPFDRGRFWFEAKTPARTGVQKSLGPAIHPLLGSRVPTPLPQRIFECRISCRNPAYLIDHRVEGVPVLPAAAYLEMGLAIARELFGDGPHRVENLYIHQALVLPEGVARLLQVTVSGESTNEATFEIFSAPAESANGQLQWTLHATGKVLSEKADGREVVSDSVVDLQELEKNIVDRKTRTEFYQLIAERKLEYGPSFQGIDLLRRRPCDAIAKLDPPAQVRQQAAEYVLHPAWLDASLHIMAGVVPLEVDGSYTPNTYVPTFIRSVRILGDPKGAVWTYAVRRSEDDRPSPPAVEADVLWLDSEGRVVVALEGVRVERLGQGPAELEEKELPRILYRLEWIPSGEAVPQDPAGTLSALKTVPDLGWVLLGEPSALLTALAEELSGHNVPLFVAELETDGSRTVRDGSRIGTERAPAEISWGSESSGTVVAANGQRIRCRVSSAADLSPIYSRAREVLGGRPVRVVYVGGDSRSAKGFSVGISQSSSSVASFRQKLPPILLGATQELLRSGLTVERFVAVTQGVPLWNEQNAVDEYNDGNSKHLARARAGANPIDPLGQSLVWGFLRSVGLEHPELRCLLVDCDPEASESDNVRLLLEELARPEGEPQVAFRAGKRWVPRIVYAEDIVRHSARAQSLPPREGPFRIRLTKTGSFDSLHWESIRRSSPAPGQVELEVHAAGLNFSDVLKVLGLYPGITDPVVPLGIECSGVVTAVGEGVERLRIGDEVFGVAPFSFASHAISAEYALVHKPAGISHTEAATIPITFLTAYYALVWLARLQKGERVLIHAGAGGVGIAAIQIAQHIGAEIFATAGSERKREFLRSLGVHHVLDSRSLRFADEIRRITGHEGVDVVLNSLPGEMMTASLGILRAYGRFLEIGKIDIYQNRMIGLAPFKDNLSYFAIDLDRLLRQRPELVRQLLGEILEHFQAGHYRPLPVTEFAAADIQAAFRYMAQRKNIGKIVIRIKEAQQETTGLTTVTDGSTIVEGTGVTMRVPEPGTQEQPVSPSTGAEDFKTPVTIREDATYLITGGLGALGLQLAKFLADHGARFLVLVGRKAASEKARLQLEELERRGVRVIALQADVTQLESLQTGVASLPAEFPPIRGIVHAAGVLEDRLLRDMDEKAFQVPLLPKVDGTWNLYLLTQTQGLQLDFLLLYSSIASVLGSPAQSNYAAGNAFLDAFAVWSRQKGLPAIVVNWGPWAEGGMAANAATARSLEMRGLRLMPPALAFAALEKLLAAGAERAIVVQAEWSRVQQALGGRQLPILEKVAGESSSATVPAKPEVDHAFLTQLQAVDNSEELTQALQEYFTRELARIMGLEAGSVDPDAPLSALGMDSLMAMELKNNLEARLNFTLPMSSFVENPSIASLASAAAVVLQQKKGQKLGGRETTDEWRPLVELASGPDRPPLFVFHPLAGDLRCYLALAQELTGKWPLLGLEARGADGRRDPYLNGEEMIGEYLQAIRQKQSEGPYFLAGWSAGGILALEMARRLLAEGSLVAFLAFMDTPLPSIYDGVDLQDEAKFLCDLVDFTSHFNPVPVRLSYEKLRQLPADQVFQAALNEAKLQGAVPPETSPEFVRRLCQAGRTNVEFIKHYKLTPVDLEIVMLLPAQRGVLMEMSGKELRPDLGWSMVTGQRFRILEVPGDHFSMLERPHVVVLAQRLLEEMEAAWQQHASKLPR
jgi:acyl transferase domain-containing protein/NADPH:quinone reductase-like Zn-dependent oxidoreductase/thioesterase domain-containing protein/acyl carrier protein